MIQLLDLCGVFVFALSGAVAAGRKQMDAFGVVVLATLTAVGGGTLRDIVSGEVPLILRREIYATAALLGALGYLGARALGAADPVCLRVGAASALALRLAAIRFGLSLPTLRWVD